MLRLNNLDSAVNKVHAYFDEWEKRSEFANRDAPHEKAVHEARLATHEWMANLVQHANFGDRRPLIGLDVQQKQDAIRCVITDNSKGFDLQRELKKVLGADGFDALPDRGMGLLMLDACTSDLSYEIVGQEQQHRRLVFRVTPYDDPTSDFAADEEIRSAA